MWVKRWILLTVFGIIMISMGFVTVLLEQGAKNKLLAAIVIIVGILAVITGIKRIIKSFIMIFLPKGIRCRRQKPFNRNPVYDRL